MLQPSVISCKPRKAGDPVRQQFLRRSKEERAARRKERSLANARERYYVLDVAHDIRRTDLSVFIQRGQLLVDVIENTGELKLLMSGWQTIGDIVRIYNYWHLVNGPDSLLSAELLLPDNPVFVSFDNYMLSEVKEVVTPLAMEVGVKMDRVEEVVTELATDADIPSKTIEGFLALLATDKKVPSNEVEAYVTMLATKLGLREDKVERVAKLAANVGLPIKRVGPGPDRFLYARVTLQVRPSDFAELVARLEANLASFAERNGWRLGDTYLGLTGDASTIVQTWAVPEVVAPQVVQRIASAPWSALLQAPARCDILDPSPSCPLLGRSPVISRTIVPRPPEVLVVALGATAAPAVSEPLAAAGEAPTRRVVAPRPETSPPIGKLFKQPSKKRKAQPTTKTKRKKGTR
jgi:hypothetical protein